MNAERRDTMARQNRLLATKTVRLKKAELNVRYAALGDPANPPVLLLHGVPENLQAWYGVAPLLAEKYHVLAPCNPRIWRKRWSLLGQFRVCCFWHQICTAMSTLESDLIALVNRSGIRPEPNTSTKSNKLAL